MKTYIDRKKIGRRAELSNLTSIGGLILLLAAVVAPLFLPKVANLAFILMVLGLGTAMVGIYFANRWVRKPRPEEMLDKALKGLADSYHLFHYPPFPSDHLLLTPNGIVILETVGLGGAFTYQAGRWKEAMTIGRALRFIVEEHLGDPIQSACRTEQFLRGQLERVIGPEVELPFKPMVVFIHPAAELEVEKASIPVLRADKLKKQVTIDAPRLDAGVYERLDAFLQKATLNK